MGEFLSNKNNMWQKKRTHFRTGKIYLEIGMISMLFLLDKESQEIRGCGWEVIIKTSLDSFRQL